MGNNPSNKQLHEALSYEGEKDLQIEQLLGYLHYDPKTCSHPDWVARAQSAEAEIERLRAELQDVTSKALGAGLGAVGLREENERLRAALDALVGAVGALSTPDNEFPCINEGPERDGLVESWLQAQDILGGTRPVETTARPPDELTAWECSNCGEIHRLHMVRCGCGWGRAHGRAEFRRDVEKPAETAERPILADCSRFRWLTSDIADPYERDHRNLLIARMIVMSYSAICAVIDATMLEYKSPLLSTEQQEEWAAHQRPVPRAAVEKS